MLETDLMITKSFKFIFSCLLVLLIGVTAHAQQLADPHFNATVANPAYTKNYPRVLFDEAHNNFHTAAGPYKPFADLLFSDGYQLVVNRKPFTKVLLSGFKIMVIANPLGAEDADEEGAERPAFTDEEADMVRDWVRGGGALLLIADDPPFSSASETLAKRLEIDMGKGVTVDPANADKGSKNPGYLVYSRENQLLVDHAITRGRSDAERINRVLTFVGQSLK